MRWPAPTRPSCRSSRTGGRSIPGPRRRPCWPAHPGAYQRGSALAVPPFYYPVAMSPSPPSGEQFALTFGDQRVVVTEVGAGLRTYTVGDRDLIDGYGEDDMCTMGRGQLKLPSLLRLEANDRLIPTGRLLANRGTAFDFLELRPIGSLSMDTAFAAMVPDGDGLIRVHFQAPSGDPSLTLWMEPIYRFLMVYTPDVVPEAVRRRQSLAIEPMTCAPNAFRSGDGLIVLEPGQSTSATWGILR